MSKRSFLEISDLVAEVLSESASKIRAINNNESTNPVGIKYASEHGLIIGFVAIGNLEKLNQALKHHKIPAKHFDKAMQIACEKNNEIIINRLLQDPRINYSTGNNCLLLRACTIGQEEFIEKILADPSVNPAINENQPIQIACEKGYSNIVRMLLLDKRVNPTEKNNIAFINACKRGHTQIVQMLLDYTLNGNFIIPSDNNNSALLAACVNGHIEIVNMLLNNIRVYIRFDYVKLLLWTHIKYTMNRENTNRYNILKMLYEYVRIKNYMNNLTILTKYTLYDFFHDSTLLFLQDIE
jgi:hypothetical protein